MSVIYSWKIKEIKKQNNPILELNNVVVWTSWECTGTDENGNFSTFVGTTTFDQSEVDTNSFTSFEDLTEQQVIGWVQNKINSEYMQHIEADIMEKIDKSLVPIVEAPLPWEQGDEVP